MSRTVFPSLHHSRICPSHHVTTINNVSLITVAGLFGPSVHGKCDARQRVHRRDEKVRSRAAALEGFPQPVLHIDQTVIELQLYVLRLEKKTLILTQ